METREWRLILDEPGHGAWNMAVDEALLDSAIRAPGKPTLRLFAWNPGCLSLGRAQSIQDVDLAGVRQSGWEIVRRPSGGRAILHIDELTYSITGSNQEPILENGILESYLKISRGLVRFLEMLEISPEVNQAPPATENKAAEPICFEVPSHYEITYQGKKIIGSAQARKENGVLQHGSIPLTGDITRITKGLRYDDEDSRHTAAYRMARRAATVEEITGRSLQLDEAAASFARAFEEEFFIRFIPGKLTGEEKAAAEHLLETKYGHPDWNERI